MDKRCEHCGEFKPLGAFFSPPEGAAGSWQGTSKFCKDCHNAGKIQYGYGDYGDKYTSPDWSKS